MANTYVDYTGDNSETDFIFNFDYLQDDHVKVKVNDVIVTNYSIVEVSADNVIRFDTAPTSDASIRIYRDSRGDFSPLVDFVDGSVLTESELDQAYKHNLFVSQEASEGTGNELLNKKGGANYDAEGNKIINLGTPTTGTDAANKGYVDQTIDNSIALGGSPAIVSLGGYDVTDITGSLTQSLANWTAPTATGTTAARSLADRFANFVNVLDFFEDDEDPTVNSQAAFTRAVAHGGTILVPAGTYQFGSRVEVNNPTTFIGENGSKTVLERNYSPGTGAANDTKGIFYMTNGSSFSGLRDMTLRSKTGQAGGCLIAIEVVTEDPPREDSIGLYSFMNVDFTTLGTSTHDYTIYMDGTARTEDPIGIRGVDMVACSVFGARISTILAKGVLKWSFLGGGVYTSGGAATSNVRMDGTASVYTEHFTFQPTDCTSPISMDYAKLGYINTPSVPALYNTSNTNNITFIGYENPDDLSDFENNWADSNVIHTRLGVILKSSQTNGSLIESDRLNGKLVNSNDYTPASDIHIKNGSAYLENSFVKTSNKTCNATDIVNGNEYEILTVGTTDFTLIGAANNNVGTVFTATGVGTGTGTVVGNAEVGHVGTPQTVTLAQGESIDINISGGMLLHIQSGAGNAGLFFAEQASSTITTISDPSSKYQLTSTPAVGFFGVYKSAASSIISLKNNASGSPLGFSILVLGRVITVSDPA